MQLVVRRTSWWEDLHLKQAAVVWIPVAVAQAGTLAAAGYLYQRLEHLEQQTASAYQPPVLGNVLRDVNVTTPVRAARVPPPPPPAFPAAVPVRVALDNPSTLDVMRVGQDFSRLPSPTVAKLVDKPVDGDVAPPSGKVRISEPPTIDLEGGRTADANRASVGVRVAKAAKTVAVVPAPSLTEEIVFVAETDVVPAMEAVAVEPAQAPPVTASAPLAVDVADTGVAAATNAETAPVVVPRGNPLPVGFESWVYLGELRPHGWHGQRLHVAPDSGLPEVGSSYRTQELHGLYSRPHGSRAMGGFQQGDLITILEVQHEANYGVWAKVRKAEAVGRHNSR